MGAQRKGLGTRVAGEFAHRRVQLTVLAHRRRILINITVGCVYPTILEFLTPAQSLLCRYTVHS
jgi:hypothetical protein